MQQLPSILGQLKADQMRGPRYEAQASLRRREGVLRSSLFQAERRVHKKRDTVRIEKEKANSKMVESSEQCQRRQWRVGSMSATRPVPGLTRFVDQE